ncbi:hypothetical protein DFH11DRAFT_1617153 [Phellopilus nigrolimitatus]|nr:hypothetical protein DFH11DRAFT_1617153 [Phellopilus nigrolimitatus]
MKSHFSFYQSTNDACDSRLRLLLVLPHCRKERRLARPALRQLRAEPLLADFVVPSEAAEAADWPPLAPRLIPKPSLHAKAHATLPNRRGYRNALPRVNNRPTSFTRDTMRTCAVKRVSARTAPRPPPPPPPRRSLAARARNSRAASADERRRLEMQEAASHLFSLSCSSALTYVNNVRHTFFRIIPHSDSPTPYIAPQRLNSDEKHQSPGKTPSRHRSSASKRTTARPSQMNTRTTHMYVPARTPANDNRGSAVYAHIRISASAKDGRGRGHVPAPHGSPEARRTRPRIYVRGRMRRNAGCVARHAARASQRR